MKLCDREVKKKLDLVLSKKCVDIESNTYAIYSQIVIQEANSVGIGY